MRIPWKWIIATVPLVLSVGLNVMLIGALTEPRPQSLQLFQSADSIESESVINQLTNAGDLAVFVGEERLGPDWLPCAGQVIARGEYPKLDEFFASQPVRIVHDAEEPTGFRLPDYSGLGLFDWVNVLRNHEPESLRDRLALELITTDFRHQTLCMVPAGQALSDDDGIVRIKPVIVAVRVR